MMINNFNPQSGRSMVEMLGVLAVIGVLSIGGVMGYSYGMDKYRANQIMNDVNLRAIDVISQYTMYEDANLNEWPTTTAGDYTIKLEDETIGIQVNEVPRQICNMIFEGMIDTVTVKINGTEYTKKAYDVCSDKNTMVFYYDEALDSRLICNCDEDEICENGRCFKTGEIKGRMWENEDFPEDGSEGCGPCGNKNNGKCEGSELLTFNSWLPCELEDGTTGQCLWGKCMPINCSGNNDVCGPNEYCSYTEQTTCDIDTSQEGTCLPLDFKRYVIDGNIYYVGNALMTWANAKTACEKLGVEMLTYEESKSLSSAIKEQLYQQTNAIATMWPAFWTNECWTAFSPKNIDDYSGYQTMKLTEDTREGKFIAICHKK